MTTSNADIQRLIDRFMSGQTSLDEEARLAAYFRTHDVPDEWADYKALFAYFDAGMPEAVSGKAATVIAVVPWWRKASRWAAAAAVVAAVAAAALHFTPTGSDSAGSPQRPTVAQTVTAARQEASATPVPAVSEAEPHIAQAVNAVKARTKAKSAHRLRPLAREVQAPTADGVAEYSAMVVAAEYDQWMARLESDIRTQQAMALMEQGAAVAVMCSDSGDVPEVP